MPRMAIRMAWAAQWAALGPYLQTMLPRYAVQLTQLSGPLSGVVMAPIVGVYSDQSTSRYGRRRPYLVVSAVGSIICWVLMGYTRELGDALGDVGSGKPGEVTDRKWTALLTVVFYLGMEIAIHISLIPALLLISDFAGRRQTLGSAMGHGWSTLGAIVVAAYTEFFGAAYNSMHWFLGMLSVFMAVCVGASCYVAKETPLDKQTMDKRSCCKNVTFAFGSIYGAVKTLPGVLAVYCTVIFLNQYAFAAYNGNKGMLFGLEVFNGDATNSATCGDECSEEQRDYNRGVRLAGGLADMLFCIVGYLYSWVLPPLVRRFGAKKIATLATIPQVLLMFMAFCDVVALDVIIVALTSITISTFFALIVPIIVHIFGHTADIGVYVGVVGSAISSGQLLNFIVGSVLVETSMGYRLPIFVGGAVSLLAFLVCVIFFRIKMFSL
ncbi:Glycoside-Pentoside-Hexuronide (GPH):Cation Symporter Family [Phytophthora infestans T30-4]|uniref:Glycoside-Pentoside-Hexuronide (GPH):Cation Symporter Family n=3 Tax=Phytophthora infestans TaxID=4787 RepID=D0MRZ3_PHYIT|nr:Glycoside-Pentoside-Hexuronide (GPH):Cation Symporter Family [Phytophthora infestans T30-4]EEY58262.1 Glycoside-Pentoside-Hexuronide (GPH):Cation Symporter Family [Phytophthora infestans T30-4]|eukprot:XP_002909448.1 Glycoside-Pentoside-Hexuronide (GPH):Cation Symporter Family [Phytophthora infestans T30-4]